MAPGVLVIDSVLPCVAKVAWPLTTTGPTGFPYADCPAKHAATATTISLRCNRFRLTVLTPALRQQSCRASTALCSQVICVTICKEGVNKSHLKVCQTGATLMAPNVCGVQILTNGGSYDSFGFLRVIKCALQRSARKRKAATRGCSRRRAECLMWDILRIGKKLKWRRATAGGRNVIATPRRKRLP